MKKKQKDLGNINGDAALQDLARSFPSTKHEKEKTRPEKEHPLTVRIPMYVAQELRKAYAETGKSQRLIVLEALKAWGIPVKKRDLRPKRRSPQKI